MVKCTKNHPTITGFKYIPSCPEGYNEKIEMKWVSVTEIKAAINSSDSNGLYRRSFLKSMELILSESESGKQLFYKI